MKNLAGAQRRVTILLKVLWQSYVVRMLRAKVGVVVHHAGLRWIATVEHRAAGRIAQRELCISSIEPSTPRCQAINIGRLDDRITIAAQLWPQIIGDDKQNVILRLLRRSR